MTRLINLEGKIFGAIIVLNLSHTNKMGSYWNCLCNCGIKKVIRGNYLREGKTRSCGCKHYDRLKFSQIKHGQSYRGKVSPEYSVWHSMKQRCYQPSHDAYKFYGAKGITVCEEWKNSFQQFLQDMGRRPSRNHSIDRIDPKGNYCKNNCRWILKSENSIRRHYDYR